jgi:hypothetical protein
MVVAVMGFYESSSYCDTSLIYRSFCVVVWWPKNMMMLADCLLETA